MLDASENLILVFYDNATYALVRTVEQSASFFGGPLEYKLKGKRFGPRRFHHIANLSTRHVPVSVSPGWLFVDIPLIYGMCYSGCRIRYEFDHSSITLLEVDPTKSSRDWPYQDYPANLPYCPLALGKRIKQSWREFAAKFDNMPDQQPSELVAVVPPPATLGVSLWGKHGDAEGVAIVFECDVDAKRIAAYNVCS